MNKNSFWRSGRIAATSLAACLTLGCVTQTGVATQDAIDEAVREAMASRPEPVIVAAPPVVQEPIAAAERFDIDVADADARDFFMSLVEGTDNNLVVHPEVTGSLSLSLKQVTLTDVLETVRDVYGYDFRRTGNSWIVLPVALQTRVFEIDYLNLSRAGLSRTRVSSGQVSQSSNRGNDRTAGNNGSAIAADDGDNTETMGSLIDTVSATDFWRDLDVTLSAILGSGEGRQIVVNAQSGVVFARGMPEELRSIGDYLDRLESGGVAVNVAAPAQLTRDALPLLRRADRPRIVNVGSMFGSVAFPRFAAYSATKFAMRGLSDALRRELQPDGIGVTYATTPMGGDHTAGWVVADNLRNYLENGVIKHSVNLPEADMPRMDADDVAMPDSIRGSSPALVHPNLALAQHPVDPGPRDSAQPGHQEIIQSLARLLGAHCHIFDLS